MAEGLGTVNYVTWPPAGVDPQVAQTHLAGIRDRLHFLALEVRQQFESTKLCLQGASHLQAPILAREDYIDNLRSTLENQAYSALAELGEDDIASNLVRAANVVASNLERIADFCVNIIGQLQYLDDRSALEEIGFAHFFTDMLEAFEHIEEGLWQREIKRGLALCRCEERVDAYYREAFGQVMERLAGDSPPENLVTSLFIFRYLERSADALLNAGEAVLFASLGEKVKISHFEAMESTLEAADVDLPTSDLRYQGFWGTRSGSRIGALRGGADEETSPAKWTIYKEGSLKKIEEERDGIARWSAVFPSLVPRVYGMHQVDEKNASLLMEFIPGDTLQSLVVEGPDSRLAGAMDLFLGATTQVWDKSREVGQPSAPCFVKQMQKRVGAVLGTHPQYGTDHFEFGQVQEDALDSLIDAAKELDEVLVCPFQVLLHGDCNLDNVLVNLEKERLRLIDLHRATGGDYLQDVSVFMVSNFRLPTFDTAIRRRIEWACYQAQKNAQAFAAKHGDEAMDARLALGVARSFLTSTRFELRPALSDQMFQRSVYLIRSLLSHRKSHGDANWPAYQFPASIYRI